MHPDELIQRITQSRAAPPAGEQLELLLALTRVYEEAGVLSVDPLPALHRACPMASACWGGVRPTGRPTGVGKFDPASENGCIVLPWVGPRYRRGGVCVLGLNLRYGGGDTEFAAEHRIAREPQWGQEEALRGRHKAHGSPWAAATMRDAAAVSRAQRGLDPETRDPDELAETLLSTSRVQIVKCSPIGGRSSPEPAMIANCPRRYLAREIAVLQPKALLVYGRAAHGALPELGKLVIEEEDGGFRRGEVQPTPSERVIVLLLTHPSNGGWRRAHDALVRSLRARPAI